MKIFHLTIIFNSIFFPKKKSFHKRNSKSRAIAASPNATYNWGEGGQGILKKEYIERKNYVIGRVLGAAAMGPPGTLNQNHFLVGTPPWSRDGCRTRGPSYASAPPVRPEECRPASRTKVHSNKVLHYTDFLQSKHNIKGAPTLNLRNHA